MAYSLDDVKKATDIYVYLLENGELKAEPNKELFDTYGEVNVKEVLEGMAERSNIHIRKIVDAIYLIPNIDNEFLGYKRSELKVAILGRQSEFKLEDYYLSIYIIILILSEFYGGKGATIQLKDSIELTFIENTVSERLEPLTEKDVTELEGETKLAISVIANLWFSSGNDDDYAKIRTRRWYVKKVCEFLKKEGLVNILDDINVTPTTKLNRVVLNHLLNAERLYEINSLLNLEEVEVEN
ncbi:DUF6063 family protein [Clostridium sp. CS001]|uniref:DUF6063 family protein n=1 Tax=Clostridium sp. CS001 TaxID=2880648 RepID=UPI001CF51448|nr:DUF6063 family protein [Clostridium sp. CS001]MCB2290819.1 DUF6063 family protein [Clostridium sp. CS001]